MTLIETFWNLSGISSQRQKPFASGQSEGGLNALDGHNKYAIREVLVFAFPQWLPFTLLLIHCPDHHGGHAYRLSESERSEEGLRHCPMYGFSANWRALRG